MIKLFIESSYTKPYGYVILKKSDCGGSSLLLNMHIMIIEGLQSFRRAVRKQ